MKAKKILSGCLVLFVALMILGRISYAIFKEKMEAYNEIRIMIDKLNNEAPCQVNVATWFTGATFSNDTLTYNIELRGNRQIESIYVNNQNTFRYLTLLGWRMMEEQREVASVLSEFLKTNNIVLEYRFALPSKKTLSFSFTGDEISNIISQKNLTSETALMSALNLQINLLNLSLPFVWDEEGNVISLGKDGIYSPWKYQILKSVTLNGRDVVYHFSIP